MDENTIVVRSDEKSIVILDQKKEWVFVADPEGRLSLVHTPGASYKRSRHNRWFRVIRDPWPGLEHVDTEVVEKLARDWRETWTRSLPSFEEQPRLFVQQWTDRFLEFHAEDAERFRRLIPAIPILPPDAYQALYLRVHEGCPWNRCSFCSFYKEDSYRVLTPADLLNHAQELREYWKKAARSRHGIFLGDANAVALPADQLIARMQIIHKAFPEPELQEFQSFIDFFSGSHRTPEEMRELQRHGLHRISLGVESGNMDLMRLVNKPLAEEALQQIVSNARNAGIHINLIFLVGLGGEKFRDLHRQDSIRLIALLGERLRIYLSPLVVHPDEPYAEIARSERWQNLDDSQLRAEMGRWQAELRQFPGLQISPYHIQQFLY